MSGNDVQTPCPISALGQITVIVLSAAMLTNALNFVGCVAPRASPPRPIPPSVKAKVTLAAPATTDSAERKGEGEAGRTGNEPAPADAGVDRSVPDLNGHGLSLPSGALNGPRGARVGSAPARAR